MSRIPALLNAAVLLGLAGCANLFDKPVQPPSAGVSAGSEAAQSITGLSSAARRVSQIAARNGDKTFLMIDKAQGSIIVFEQGKATFSGSALTGQNPADHMPPDAWDKPFSALRDVKYKITPAGRYTVSSSFDKAYGTTLDVNEVQGLDWDIAIHRVWLGAPAERRDARLQSSNAHDKRITYGCIDVDAETMRQLLRRTPGDQKTPIYILPADESLITELFEARKPAAPSG